MLKQKDEKTCLSCGKAVRGRSDKKFCDDYCRAAYNNDLKSAVNNFMRNVNNALGKNRRVLESLLPDGEPTTKASRDKLIEKGFQNYKKQTIIWGNFIGQIVVFRYFKI